MKNKKAIILLISAGIIITIAALFKDSMPKIIHYALCVLSIIIACVSAHIEKTK